MKLSELEAGARLERVEAEALAAEEQLEKQMAAEEAAEELRRKIIAWMVEEGDLDADELGATLSVVDLDRQLVRLSVPEHTDITFRVIPTDDGYKVRDGRFEVERSFVNYTRYCHSLRDALLCATEEWRGREEQQAREAERKADRETERKLREELAAERGAKYLDLLNDHPILRPILDLLGAFMEEREQFAEDLEMAEELHAGAEARYQEKLEQAQYEANRYAGERDDLQRDLRDEQEKRREAERKSRRGW